MKQLLKIGSFLFLFMAACNTSDSPEEAISGAEDDLDAGRNFIRYTLDGDYAKARKLMFPDSTNLEQLDIYERAYKERMSESDKMAYKQASINIHELKKLNDSTSLLRYSNSYFKKDTHQLKIIRVNDQWLVDFKSYFMDMKDSLP